MKADSDRPLDAKDSGIYFAPSSPVSLQKKALAAGLAWFNLDLARVNSKKRLLAVCQQEFAFPETFGANWDAFADCLQDFSWWRAEGYVINVTHAAHFARAAPQDFSLLLEILDYAARYWKQKGKIFIVLIDHQPRGMLLPTP